MSKVIEVNQLGKLYRLGKIGTGTLSHDLKRWWAITTKGEDPYQKIGSINDRTKAAIANEFVWALKDITFQINSGEVVGIIGKNGAGKSTLLKVLSSITAPSVGEAKMRGRVGSLLEVGTGFHPEMTGRENIYMNGTILGMRKYEIDRRFDEIVEFAGVAKYIDTPVKRYSSGMLVRLGFAVAAFLEPEILIVDEVLAVGDSEFQRKAMGKMKEVSESSGRTVLFVTHNMGSIRKLCNRCIGLNHGSVQFDGDIVGGIDWYQKRDSETVLLSDGSIEWQSEKRPGRDELRLDKITLKNDTGEVKSKFLSSESISCCVTYTLSEDVRNFRLNLQLHSSDDVVLFTSTSHGVEPSLKKCSTYNICFKIPSNFLNEGSFKVFLQADIPFVKTFGLGECYLGFEVVLNHYLGTISNNVLKGYLSPQLDIFYE